MRLSLSEWVVDGRITCTCRGFGYAFSLAVAWRREARVAQVEGEQCSGLRTVPLLHAVCLPDDPPFLQRGRMPMLRGNGISS